jgi:hypothetical protein
MMARSPNASAVPGGDCLGGDDEVTRVIGMPYVHHDTEELVARLSI